MKDQALQQTASIAALQEPQSADLGFLQEWLERQEGGDFFLNRIERGAYDRKFHSDLITVSGMYKELAFWSNGSRSTSLQHTIP